MPISALDGCSENHWSDVHEILVESIDSTGFEPNLVSNADDVGIIQKRIIQNLYDNPIVVCDVSGKNPNVMFELGMRLAFDRPAIIVKDDKTSYTFDTSPIEHLEYPRDLRFSKIVEFKDKLADKIKKTHDKATTDPNYTTFLKHFGEFKVAKIEKKEVSGQEFILEELRNLRLAINRLDRKDSLRGKPVPMVYSERVLDICLEDMSDSEIDSLAHRLMGMKGVIEARIVDSKSHKHFLISMYKQDAEQIKRTIIERIPELESRASFDTPYAHNLMSEVRKVEND